MFCLHVFDSISSFMCVYVGCIQEERRISNENMVFGAFETSIYFIKFSKHSKERQMGFTFARKTPILLNENIIIR